MIAGQSLLAMCMMIIRQILGRLHAKSIDLINRNTDLEVPVLIK